MEGVNRGAVSATLNQLRRNRSSLGGFAGRLARNRQASKPYACLITCVSFCEPLGGLLCLAGQNGMRCALTQTLQESVGLGRSNPL